VKKKVDPRRSLEGQDPDLEVITAASAEEALAIAAMITSFAATLASAPGRAV